MFTYVQPPSGLLVELVSTAVQPMFERWFAGGPLLLSRGATRVTSLLETCDHSSN